MVTGEKSEERRKHNRIPFDARVFLKTTGEAVECQLVDISLKGVLVKLPPRPDEERIGEYFITLRLTVGTKIEMKAIRAHREGDELGLKWVDIDLDSLTHLRRLLELNTGDPTMLQRELSDLG